MSDGQLLAIELQARIERYVSQLARSQQQTDRRMRQIEQRTTQTAARMEQSMAGAAGRIGTSLSTLGKGFLTGIAGAATLGGLSALVGRLGSVAEGVANIGSEAKRAGLTTRVFQEWSHVANQTRIPIDALVDGFKELAIRADEFVVTGKGSGEEAFKRLGFSASDLARRLQDPSALMLEIIRRMERLDEASQIRVADEVFGGTGGERFVELLGKGEAGIRAMIREAHDFGLVLDDAMIAKADDIDRRFKLIASTIGTGLKRAVVEVVDAMDGLFDGLREIERQRDGTIQSWLATIFADRAAIMNRIAEMEKQDAEGWSPFKNTNELKLARAQLQTLTDEAARLKDVLDRRSGYPGTIAETGTQATDAGPKVKTLADNVANLNSAGTTGAKGIETFADAVRALKNEMPGLTDQLAELDAKARIETAYRAALQKARSIGDTITAERLRDEALAGLASAPARDAAGKGMLDLIGYAEGTDKGRGYNETLGYGKFTGGNRNLVTMTLDEVDRMQTAMLRHPDNNFNSSAAGRYQIVQKTLRGLRSELGLSGGEFFDAQMQDRLAQQLLRRRGNNVAGLRNEWEGLRRIDGDLIGKAYDGASVAMPAMDDGLRAKRDERANEAKQQQDAYKDILADAARYRSDMQTEAQALGMTKEAATRLRVERQLLNDVERAGIALSPAQRTELAQVAQSMADAELAADRMGEAQGRAQEVAAQWQSIASGAVKGLVSDLLAGKDAGEAFGNVLSRIADQLISMAVDQLFANAFSGAGKGQAAGGGVAGGGWMAVAGKFLGSLFGFADGGFTGQGGKYEPAGVVHKGEYVLSKAATERLGVANLDALHQNALRGFSDGGYVGASPAVRRAQMPANGNTAGSVNQTITLAPTVNLTATGGTPEQNQDLARQTSKAIESQMRALIVREISTQLRPGGIMGRR